MNREFLAYELKEINGSVTRVECSLGRLTDAFDTLMESVNNIAKVAQDCPFMQWQKIDFLNFKQGALKGSMLFQKHKSDSTEVFTGNYLDVDRFATPNSYQSYRCQTIMKIYHPLVTEEANLVSYCHDLLFGGKSYLTDLRNLRNALFKMVANSFPQNLGRPETSDSLIFQYGIGHIGLDFIWLADSVFASSGGKLRSNPGFDQRPNDLFEA